MKGVQGTALFISILLTILILFYIGKMLNSVMDDYFDMVWLRGARKRLYRGIARIMDNWSEDKLAVSEINLLYENTVEKFSVLKRENLTTPWDMISDLIWRLDTSEESDRSQKYPQELHEPDARKRLSTIRDMLQEEFRFPQVEGEQALLFRSLGYAIKHNELEEASELLSQLASFVTRTIKEERRRSRMSFVWTIVGAVVGILGLIPSINSMFKS